MYAVVETGGKQYRVTAGDVISVEKLEGKAGEKITLDKILSAYAGSTIKLGAPTVAKATISAEIVEQKKDDKVIVFKKKRRHNYRRMKGHRQNVTVLRVADITIDGKKTSAPAAAKPAAKKADAPKKVEAKKAPAKKAAPKAAAAKKPAAKKPAAKKSDKK